MKTPKPRMLPNAGATMYRSPQGFSLSIGASLTKPGQELTIGAVRLKLDHRRRAIIGTVPASWLVDLNRPGAVTVDHVE